MSGQGGDGGQRIDRWLWFARLFKSRSLASLAVENSGVRVTRQGVTQRVEKPAFVLRVRDVVTLRRQHDVLVVEVVGLGARRGPASEARGLYKDLSPAVAAAQLSATSPRPPARPGKRERREISRLKAATCGE